MGINFEWEKAELSLKDFVLKYKNRLPLLVRVSHGVCGKDDSTFSFATNEEIYITHVNVQKRLVAKDREGRKLSIPTEYPIRFHEIQHGRMTLGAPLWLRDLKGSSFPQGMRIIPEDTRNLKFWVGADQTVRTEIHDLEVLSVYDDSYLVGNAIVMGELQDCPVYIPLFLNIKVNIAHGLKHGSKAKFHETISGFQRAVNLVVNQNLQGNPEIMLYTGVDDTMDDEYTYMEPRSIISCKQAIPAPQAKNLGSFKKPQFSPEVPNKPSPESNRTSKPLPKLPPENVRDQSPDIRRSDSKKKESVKHPVPLKICGSNPGFSVTQDGLHSVKLKTFPRSRSMSDKDNYANMKTDQHEYDRAINARTSMSEIRRPSLFDGNIYVEIPADQVGQGGLSNIIETEQADTEDRPERKLSGEDTDKKEEDGSGYMKVGDVPRSLKGITIKGVGKCLKLLHLDKYVENFEDNQIDGDLLLSLEDSVFKNDFGMSQLEVMKLHKFVHEGWRPK